MTDEAPLISATARLAMKELRLREILRQGHYPGVPKHLGRPLATTKKVLFVAALVALLLAALAYGTEAGRTFVHRDPESVYTAAGALLLITLMFSGYTLVLDLRVPGSEGRTSPVKGLQAFLGAIRTGRFAYAHHCLVPGEPDQSLRVRSARGEIVSRGEYRFADVDGLRDYWREFNRWRSFSSREMHFSSFSVESEEGDFAVVTACMLLKAHVSDQAAQLWLLGHSSGRVHTEDIFVSKLLRRIENLWYVVNGELSSAEDKAMGEAARLAGVSDAQLISATKGPQVEDTGQPST